MTGCYPTEVKCKCDCHVSGIVQMLTSNPPTPCCNCFATGLLEINKKENTIHPLEKRIEALEKLNQRCFDANPLEIIEKRFKKLEEDFADANFDRGNRIAQLEQMNERLYEMINMEDRITASDVLCRLTLLEQERDKGVERLKKLEEWAAKFIDTYENNLCHWQERLDKIESNLSQQNPVTDVVQDLRTPYGKALDFIKELAKDFPDRHETQERIQEEARELLKEIDPYGEQDHIVDAGKKIEFKATQDGIEISNSHLAQKIECKRCGKLLGNGLHTCTPKTATIFEAIKALRESKQVKAIHWETFYDAEELDLYSFADLLKIDDWVVKDE